MIDFGEYQQTARGRGGKPGEPVKPKLSKNKFLAFNENPVVWSYIAPSCEIHGIVI